MAEQKPKVDWLILDISNLLYRTFYAQTNEDDQTLAGLATHSALVTLNKYYKQFKPSKMVMAFDRESWRKKYTASELCLSKRPYKGNRRQDMTPSQQAKYARFMNHLREFEALITKHTRIVTLACDLLEADDLVAGFIQKYPDDNKVLVSSDSDMYQLLKHPNLQVVSPGTDKPADLSDWDNDPEFFLFVKCIRGDTSDNIRSAFPGVRKTRLRKAFDDPYEMTQLMKERWTDERGENALVEDLYNENRLLIDLEEQPPNIRNKIDATIDAAVTANKQFSYFHLMKFVGKYDLVKIRDSIDLYLPMLSS